MKIIYYDEKYLLPCAELLKKHYNTEEFGCKFDTLRASAYLQEHIFKPRFIGYLLLEKDELIGFAFCHLRTWSDVDDLFIDEFIIKDNHQNLGLGTKLLDFIDIYAQSLKLSGITTMTNIIPLTNFYRKNDFFEHDISFLYKGINPSE